MALSSGVTGEQHELRWGEHAAVVVQLGGGLRRYTCRGRDVVDGYDAEVLPDAGRGQLLVPWPNRIRDGRYRWAGTERQLALTEPEAGNAIHGLVRWLPFSLRRREDWAVTLGATLWPQPGYPHRLDVQVDYALGGDGLTVVVTGRNDGAEPAPYAAGQHPYVTVGTGLVDEAVLTVPAERWLRTDERSTPLAECAVAESRFDFREPRRIGADALDVAFRTLRRDQTGRAVTRLEHPSGDRTVHVWVDSSADCLQVYTGDSVSEPGRRRRGVAIEAMSAPPDAFRSGQGLATLLPGQTHRLRWGISPGPPDR